MSSNAKVIRPGRATCAVIWALHVVLGCGAQLLAQGKVFLSTKEALSLAFPKCDVRRTQNVLDAAAQQRVLALAGVAATRSMVFAYEARQGSKLAGTAYFDRHRVRSKSELLMVVVGPDGKVQRIEILAFGEPLDYLPRGNFYEQFVGRGLQDELHAKGAIRSVVGATLTVHATIDAVRRILATHQVLHPEQVPPQDKEKQGQEKQDKEAQGGKGNGAKSDKGRRVERANGKVRPKPEVRHS